MECLGFYIYLASVIGVGYFVVQTMRYTYRPNYYLNYDRSPYPDVYVLPGIAGFAVFPFLNTLLFIGLIVYFFARKEWIRQSDIKEQQRREERLAQWRAMDEKWARIRATI